MQSKLTDMKVIQSSAFVAIVYPVKFDWRQDNI